MRQLTPTTNITAGVLAGALATIFVWLLGGIAHVEAPAEVVSALTVVFTLAIQYLMPPDLWERIRRRSEAAGGASGSSAPREE